MHALITNDDGVDSPGLHALARAALRLGLDVTVAAPDWDSSGASASLTAVEHDGRVLLSERAIDGLDAPNVNVLALEAAPAFIARLGVEGALGPVPDIVLSGINRGANAGQAVLHSGTVGAALTARTHGRASIALSLDVSGQAEPHWDTAEAIAEHVIGWALSAEEPLVLNVNVPNRPLEAVRGLRRARLASFGAVQTTITESGSGYLKVAYTQPDAATEAGTDAALLAGGYASYTVLLPVCEAGGADTAGLGWEPASAATGPDSRSG